MADIIDDIGPADKGAQIGGRIKARQSRFPAETREEKDNALRLGREAASQMIRGTIQKNRERNLTEGARSQMTPIPQTDIVDGKVVDTGYDPAEWANYEAESRTYERRAMEDINRQPKIDALTASVNPYEQAAADVDPSFFKMMTDSEFWTRDVAPRVVNAGKGIAANTLGAPADIAVLGAHTLRYLVQNRLKTGSYGFLKDMPNFENVPLTGDWIGSNMMNARVDSPEFMVSGFLSPDLKDVALASKAVSAIAAQQVQNAMIVGGIGFSADVARTTDAVESQQKLQRFSDFLSGERVAAPDGGDVPWEDQEALWKETAFWRGPDGQVRWWLSDENIKWAEPEDVGRFITPENEKFLLDPVPGLQGTVMHTIPIGDLMDHTDLFELYPAIRNIEIDVAFQKVTPEMRTSLGEGITTYPGADGHDYIINSRAPFLAAVQPGSTVGEYNFYIGASNSLQNLRSTILHEVQHVVQGIEAMAKGGSVTEFEGMAQNLAEMQASAFNQRLFDMMESNGIDANDVENIELIIASDEPILELLSSLEAEGYTVNMPQIQLRMEQWANDPNAREVTALMWNREVRMFRQYMRTAEGTNMSVDDALAWIRNNTVLPYTPRSLYLSLAGEVESRFTQEVYERLGEDVVNNTFPKQLIVTATPDAVPEAQQIVRQEAAVALE